MVDYDLVVIGGGTAGMSAARTALRRGARVALAQAGPVGGDCTFVGCVPSKTLLAAAAQGADFSSAIERVHATVARIAATETAELLRREGIDVVEGWGRLVGPHRVGSGRSVGPHRVEVDGRVLSAPRLVLACGAGPLVPTLPGLAGVEVLTNENVFDLQSRPDSMVILGGGPVGVELAQAFARFGTAVTLVELAERILPREEPEASEVLAAALAADSVRILTGRRVTSLQAIPPPNDGGPVEVRTGGVRVTIDDGTEVSASRILMAGGRRPTSDGLGLEAAGVATDERGFIRTDAHLRTNVDGIWAAGDIAGRSQFTHAADEMGRVAAGNALSRVGYRKFRDEWISGVTFTDPEVARVGLTEAAAADRGARVAFLPMSEFDRAITAGRTDGYVKLIVGARPGTRNLAGGRLLGATIVAERAGEMIALPTLALRSHMFPARLALSTQAYPTWSLAVQQAAAQLFVDSGGRRARPAKA